jgi:type IV pilus assembly protein PilP
MKERVAFVVIALVAAAALAQTSPAPAPAPQDQTPIDTSTVERILRGEDAVEQGQGFTYDPAGRRDPFRSLLGGRPPEELGGRPPGLRGMGVEEVRVLGVMRLPEGFVAMVQGTDSLSYMIRPGTALYDGNVERIEPGRVVFKMPVADPRSLKPYREVVRTLQ